MDIVGDSRTAGQRSGHHVQLALFDSPERPSDRPAPRRRRTIRDTSRAALAELDETTVDGRVLAMFRQHGEHGLTLDEIAQEGTLLQTACGAVNRLAKSGYVQATVIRRKTRTGRKAIVWALSRQGGCTK